MAQGPFQRAIQRVANALGVLAPAQRAVRFISPFTVQDVPETQAGSTLRGDSGAGEVSGYTEIGLDTSLLPGLVTSRIIAGTSPMRINGGDSADLGATNITVSIEPATSLSPGSMSAADKALLATATVDPTPNALLLRGPSGEGKCTSFELSSGGQLRANIGGDFVNVGSVDGAKNVQLGDTLQAASLTLLAKANGNIAAAVDGTGAVVLAAIGAAAKLACFSDSFENLHAENGVLSIGSSGLLTHESNIGNFTFTASGATILSITKAPVDPAPLDTAVIESDGDISINGLHALTLNGGVGGTQSRIEISDLGTIILQVNATEVARFDAGGPPAPSTIQPNAAASAGVSTELARADHTHGIAVAIAGAIAIGDSAAEGASTSFSRADHRHSLAAPAAPQSVGAANSAGASTAPARADHVHAVAWQTELGANTLTGTTTTRYLATGYEPGTASANALDMPVTKAFGFVNMRMFARIGGTAGETLSASVRKNGVAAGTALVSATDATSGNVTFLSAVSYVPGDTWGFQVAKSGAIATSPTDIFWSIGITP